MGYSDLKPSQRNVVDLLMSARELPQRQKRHTCHTRNLADLVGCSERVMKVRLRAIYRKYDLYAPKNYSESGQLLYDLMVRLVYLRAIELGLIQPYA